MIRLAKASEKKEIFFNLVSLYGYEASFHVPEIGKTINEDGKFYIPGIERFTAQASEGYVLYEDTQPIGFVAFTEQAENNWMMDELFITRTFRTQEAVNSVLDTFFKEKHPSVFQTHILKGQKDVCEQIETYFGSSLKKEELDPIAWIYTLRK